MKARDQNKEENQSNGEAPLPAVSANTLARCLGVTPKIIYDLTKEGVIERGSGRLFQLEDSVRRYCEHLRRQTGAHHPDLVWPVPTLAVERTRYAHCECPDPSLPRSAGWIVGGLKTRCRTMTQLIACGAVPKPKRPPPRTQRGQSQGKCTE